MSDIRVCARDGEPLVFTMEFPGAEYVCVVCGGLEDIFGGRAVSTPDLAARLADLTEQYGRARAARAGRDYVPPPIAGEAKTPTCAGCGAQPEPGTPMPGGKPPHWYSRVRDGVTAYACSRGCIPPGDSTLPW